MAHLNPTRQALPGPGKDPMTDTWWILIIVVGTAAVVAAAVATYNVRGNRNLVTLAQRTSYQVLRTANLAAPSFRSGLTADAVRPAIGHLRNLLDCSAVVVTDLVDVVASEGVDSGHLRLMLPELLQAVHSERPQVIKLACTHPGPCSLKSVVVVPLRVGGRQVGTLASLGPTAPAGVLRLCSEVGDFVSTQLELSELDNSKARAARAELQFLRAQISPHFLYNALTAIESYIRSDADRARGLLVGFADLTRHTFGTFDTWTTIAEELRMVDIYLDLLRARFGERFTVDLRVAPEVLAVELPSLILQPLVENALRHGLEPKSSGKLSIAVEDGDNEALIAVEDDGVGVAPAQMRRILTGSSPEGGVGLRNVDERLRTMYGESHGLVVETALGAGTRVSMRIPKFSSGARVA